MRHDYSTAAFITTDVLCGGCAEAGGRHGGVVHDLAELARRSQGGVQVVGDDSRARRLRQRTVVDEGALGLARAVAREHDARVRTEVQVHGRVAPASAAGGGRGVGAVRRVDARVHAGDVGEVERDGGVERRGGGRGGAVGAGERDRQGLGVHAVDQGAERSRDDVRERHRDVDDAAIICL